MFGIQTGRVCVCVVLNIRINYYSLFIMDVFSLEEDNGNSLFITQESHNVDGNLPNFDICGGSADGDLNAMEMNEIDTMQFSDILDVEDFQIPSSQLMNVPAGPV